MKMLLLLALSLALFPASAVAGPWLEGSVGYARYDMEDVNDLIGEINAAIAPLEMDELNGGFTFGFGVGFDLPSGFSIGAAYERLTGSTDVSDGFAELELDVPANLFKATGAYAFPVSGPFQPALGVGVGIVSLDSELSATGEGSADFTGSGTLFEVFGQGRIWMGPRFALVPALGYRHAEISDVELEDQDLPGFEFDYSGVFVRLGLRLGF